MGAGIGALAWAAASLADEKVSEEHRNISIDFAPSIFQGENYIKVILTGIFFALIAMIIILIFGA